MVDDLHDDPRIHAGEVAQELETERRLIVERGHDPDDVAGADADLRLVVALADRAGELLGEARLEAGLELPVHA